jgi:CheY-like chemotaxis protein
MGAHPTAGDASAQTVLVIDDNDATRIGLVRLLALRGYHTVAATNGCEGLDHLRTDRSIGLVVIDLGMPNGNGYWFREQQRSDPTLAHVPLLVFTGTPPGDLDMERLRGATVLHKPVDIPRLLDTIASSVMQA